MPTGAPFLVTNKNSYAFQFYSRGRLPQAVFCPRHCFDFKDRAEKWLKSVDERAWILSTDEEINSLSKLVKKVGLGYRTRNNKRTDPMIQRRRSKGRR